VPDLLSAIDGEPDKDVLGEMLSSLSECLGVIKAPCLTNEQLTQIVTILNRLMNEHFERASERQAKRTDEDYDEQVEEELRDEDDDGVDLLSKVRTPFYSSHTVHRIFCMYNQPRCTYSTSL